MTVTPSVPSLANAAARLRAWHVPGDPLVLLNVWDVASAREVVAAGVAAVGTSSAAVAAALGEPDDDTMPAATAFAAIARIAAAVPVPVSADIEAGYGLDADELVGRLIEAGAVGCNLEDSDHRRPGALVDVDVAAARLGAVREAGRVAGVDIVVNARIDVLRHADGDREAALAEIVVRGRRYIEAGADCVFPIGVADAATVERLVAAIAAPVNVGLPAGGRIADLAAAGAGRLSMGPALHRLAMADLGQRAADLLATARSSAPGRR